MTHWHGLLRLLGYVYYTKNLKLRQNCQKPHIIVYLDADFVTNKDVKTLMRGQLIYLITHP